MDHFPNGTSMQTLMLYAQNEREDRFQIFAEDYNHVIPIHQHKHTDLIPIETINQVPIAMFVGENDKLADPTDAEWTRDTIAQDNVGEIIHYSTIKGGHLSFMIAKDMTYWTTDVMAILAKYQPLPEYTYTRLDFEPELYLQ